MERVNTPSDVPSDVNQAIGVPLPASAIPRTVGPLDLPSGEFRSGLLRRAENRKLLIHHIHETLVDGIDYGAVPVRGRLSKPSLRKPGAEKICNMCGVIPTFPSLSAYEQIAIEGKRVEVVLMRCELKNPDGNTVGEGGGARSLAQDYDDVNKSMKMCLKSAQIDATIRTFGLSEIFTQDLEDMPEAQRNEAESNEGYAPSPPVQQPQPPAGPPVHSAPAQHARPPMRASGLPPRVISDKQCKLLWVRLDQAGIPEMEFLQRWNIPQLEALPSSQMNDALSWITAAHDRPG